MPRPQALAGLAERVKAWALHGGAQAGLGDGRVDRSLKGEAPNG